MKIIFVYFFLVFSCHCWGQVSFPYFELFINFLFSFLFSIEQTIWKNVYLAICCFCLIFFFFSNFQMDFDKCEFVYCITQQVHFFFFLSSTTTWLADWGPGITEFDTWVFDCAVSSDAFPFPVFGLCWFCDACLTKAAKGN